MKSAKSSKTSPKKKNTTGKHNTSSEGLLIDFDGEKSNAKDDGWNDSWEDDAWESLNKDD